MMIKKNIDVFKLSLAVSCFLHFSLLLIPAFRSIQGQIDPSDYKIVQLMNLEPVVNAPLTNTGEGEIKAKKEEKNITKKRIEEKPISADTDNGPESAGQFALYLPFFKVMKLPEFKTRVKPVYPQKAKLQGRESEILAEVYIDAEGRPRKVIILKSGGQDFDQSVIEAISQSSFSPAISKEAKPVPVRVRIPFKFELE